MDRFRRFVASLLVVCLGGMSLPVNAGMLATEAALGAGRERVAAFVDREEVRAKLEAYGVRAADVQARVASMTDEEAQLVAARIDELPAGGVLGLLLTVFIILLITDILGFTKVFPFTKAACDRGKC
jgi:hypothetical protein